MKTLPPLKLLCIILIGLMLPLQAEAIQSQRLKRPDKKEAQEAEKMDGLSLAAYTTAVAGLVSFFLAPAASLALMPAAFILGLIALIRFKKRPERKRGRGLAIAAIAVGGGFTLFVFTSFIAFLLFAF